MSLTSETLVVAVEEREVYPLVAVHLRLRSKLKRVLYFTVYVKIRKWP